VELGTRNVEQLTIEGFPTVSREQAVAFLELAKEALLAT